MNYNKLAAVFAFVMVAVATGVAFAQAPGTLPVSFDPRPLGLTTPVGNQGNSLACWAFSTLGAAEHLVLKRTGEVYKFSPQHLRFGTSRANTSQTNFNRHPGDGTGVRNAFSYLMIDGVVFESDIPYVASINQRIEPTLPANFHTAPRRFRMTGTIVIPRGLENRDRMKAAIYEYGGLTASIAGSRTYNPANNPNFYNPISFARYYTRAGGSRSGSHSVLLVGWDDNFPKENFRMQPPANGAWLFKNSYGSTGTGHSVGDRGYFWLSYYDESLHSINDHYAFTGFEAVTANEKIVSHYCTVRDGSSLNTTNSRRRFPVANIYEISAQDAAAFQINKITFFGRADHSYNIHIIQAPPSGMPPPPDDRLWGQPYARNVVIPVISERGWITVILDRPFIPQAGKYIVMIDTYRISQTNDTRFDRAFGSAFGALDEDTMCVSEACPGSCPDCPVAVPGFRAISPQGKEGQGYVYHWTNRIWEDAYTRNNAVDQATGTRRYGGLLMQVVMRGRV